MDSRKFPRWLIDDMRRERLAKIREVIRRKVLEGGGVPDSIRHYFDDSGIDVIAATDTQITIIEVKRTRLSQVLDDEERMHAVNVTLAEEIHASDTVNAVGAERAVTEALRDLELKRVFISHSDVDHIALANLFRAKRLRRKSEIILSAWTAWMPQRVVNEEIGDYIEDMQRRLVGGEYKLVYLRLAATMFWTLLHTIGYAMKAVGLRKAG